MRPQNDYEIIAKVKEGDEEALEYLVENYKDFISRMIHDYRLHYMFDDLHQEGVILLYKSVLAFDSAFNKTFTRYFEMNFKRLMRGHINRIRRRREITKMNRDYIAESNHCLHENSVYYSVHLEEIKELLTPFEYSVYTNRIIKRASTPDIASEAGCDEKAVYNAAHRAKRKIRAYFKG
ncbi:MAG: sigma-70 family RNA polymerase sigma factor [Bacillota bacterium]